MLWTAFTIGILGSLHCVGMCGPIALALPYQGRNRWVATNNVLLYNAGRIITYSLLGLVIGLLGRGLFLAGLQTYVSIGLGILLLIVAAFSVNIEARLLRIPLLMRLNEWVKRQLAFLLRRHGRASLLLIGMLNGLLPCGLVYLAIAGAVAAGGMLKGVAFMALFGLGTVPLMLATSLAGQFINLRLRNRLRKLVPLFLVAFAILFIARGLQFQIPADFRFWEGLQEIPMCH
jgi:sulfite exporter TauE/SafE